MIIRITLKTIRIIIINMTSALQIVPENKIVQLYHPQVLFDNGWREC